METQTKGPKLRTWHHLNARRKPTEYEVVSTNAHWIDDVKEGRPFQTMHESIPLNRFYTKYRVESPLQVDDWQAFRDPDEIIYRAYTTAQDGQENYVVGLLERFAAEGHDAELDPRWGQALATIYTPARYAFHCLQMGTGYLSHIMPASTICYAAGFQAGDQLRWLSHTAYRTCELGKRFPAAGFGKTEREKWEKDPAWQGYRELMEKMLTAYDMGETFVALQLVAKPAFDEGFLRALAITARRNGDMLLALMNEAALVDSERSRRWTRALVELLLKKPENRQILQGWIDQWTPLANRAIEAYCAALPNDAGSADVAKKALADFQKNVMA